jgi:hypothetical protein
MGIYCRSMTGNLGKFGNGLEDGDDEVVDDVGFCWGVADHGNGREGKRNAMRSRCRLLGGRSVPTWTFWKRRGEERREEVAVMTQCYVSTTKSLLTINQTDFHKMQLFCTRKKLLLADTL